MSKLPDIRVTYDLGTKLFVLVTGYKAVVKMYVEIFLTILKNFEKNLFLFFFRLVKMGALDVKKVVDQHQVWRMASCMWLHAGVFHVLANMLSLLFVGIRLEQEFGFGMSRLINFSSHRYYSCRHMSVDFLKFIFALLSKLQLQLIVSV